MPEVVETLESSQRFAKRLVEEDCPKCGCNRALWAEQKPAGVHSVTCTACDYVHHRG